MKKLRDMFLSEGPWPMIALIAIGAAVFVLISIFAPDNVRTMLFGAHGFVMTVLAILVRSPLPEGDGVDDASPPPDAGKK